MTNTLPSHNEDCTNATALGFLPPQQPFIYPRKVFSDCLLALKKHKVLIIQGSIGYGKTTLLSTLYKKSSSFKLWYSFSQADNDRQCFIKKIIRGLALAQLPISPYEEELLLSSSAEQVADNIEKI